MRAGAAGELWRESYVAAEPVRARYTFNSYRASYRYRIHEAERTTLWVGATAKVRDAVVALTQSATSSRKDDLGFVPLLHLAGEWRPTPGWRVGLDADALAGGPGRAVDGALKVGYDVGERWTIQAGYRTVEGGADARSTRSPGCTTQWRRWPGAAGSRPARTGDCDAWTAASRFGVTNRSEKAQFWRRIVDR